MSILSLALVLAIVSIPIIVLLRNIQRRQELRWEQELARGPHSSPAHKATEKKPLFDTAQKLRFAIYGLIGVLLVAYLFFFILNIQRQAPLSDWSWAFLLALGLPAAGFVLYRVGVVEDAWGNVHIPSWPIVARKALMIFVALVILVVVLSRVIPKGFHIWPSLERNADQTGIKEFFAENWEDPTVLIGTLAFLALVIFGSIKRVAVAEWVYGDKTPVFPRQSAPGPTTAFVPPAITPPAAAASSSRGPWRPGLFATGIILIPVTLILLYAFARNVDLDALMPDITPGKGSWSPTPPAQPQQNFVPQRRSERIEPNSRIAGNLLYDAGPNTFGHYMQAWKYLAEGSGVRIPPDTTTTVTFPNSTNVVAVARGSASGIDCHTNQPINLVPENLTDQVNRRFGLCEFTVRSGPQGADLYFFGPLHN